MTLEDTRFSHWDSILSTLANDCQLGTLKIIENRPSRFPILESWTELNSITDLIKRMKIKNEMLVMSADTVLLDLNGRFQGEWVSVEPAIKTEEGRECDSEDEEDWVFLSSIEEMPLNRGWPPGSRRGRAL